MARPSRPEGEEPAEEPHIVVIAEAARELDRLRENWLNAPDASETELKQRTLTNRSDARSTWR